MLVDFVRYAERNGIAYNPLGPYAIKLHQIKEIIEEQRLEIQQGDILFIRCGLGKYLRSYKPDDRSPFDNPQTHVGVDPEPELIEWLWDSNFAALGGDSLSCEAVPAFNGGCKFILLSNEASIILTPSPQLASCIPLPWEGGG